MLSCFTSDKALNQSPARVLNSTWRPKLHIANISRSPFNRKPQFVTTFPPKVILFEGILVLYHKEIRDLLDMKLFVDCDSDTRLSRRGMIINFYIVALNCSSIAIDNILRRTIEVTDQLRLMTLHAYGSHRYLIYTR